MTTEPTTDPVYEASSSPALPTLHPGPERSPPAEAASREATLTKATLNGEPLTDKPRTEATLTDKPLTEEPLTEEPLNEEPLTDETPSDNGSSTGPQVSPAGMQVLRLLVGQPPRTMAELIQARGVTRTAITEQLTALQEAGLITRQVERGGRGRPKHRYSATEAALQLFPNQSGRLVPALLSAVREICGPEVTAEILQLVSDRMAGFYRSRVTAEQLGPRLEQLAAALREDGVLVEVFQEQGQWTLREKTCPFVTMVGPDREACQVEQAMLTTLLGLPVAIGQCRLDGCNGCTWHLPSQPSACQTPIESEAPATDVPQSQEASSAESPPAEA